MESERLKQAMEAGPDCPSIERLAYYADGLLPVAELEAQRAHIATCARCLTELRLLRAFTTEAAENNRHWDIDDAVAWLRHRETEIFGAGPDDPQSIKKRFSFGRLRPALTLAALLLAIGTGYYLRTPAAPPLPLDAGTGAETTRSLRVHLTAPLGDIAAVPAQLQWEAVDGAARYHVRVLEVDRQELWAGDVAGTAANLPEDVRARVSPAKTLQWQVTAFAADGRPIAESEVRRFRLSR